MSGRPGVTGTIAARLAAARREEVVGRQQEVALVRDLAGGDDRVVALFFYGPGGVGKSTVLRAAADAVTDLGRPAVLVDGAGIEASPGGFRSAVADALGLAPDAPDPLIPAGGVLLVDTFEALAGLERWLRQVFLPAQPSGALLVAAGRRPPESGWRTDAGWWDSARVLSLRNLDPAAARELLTRRCVPASLVDGLVRATHGHPLAIVVAADLVAQDPHNAATMTVHHLAGHPDLTAALLARFVDDVDEPRQRRALHLLAHARRVDRPLLARVLQLPEDEADDVLAWLRARPYVDAGPDGLYMHDVARDVLDRDLRWRDGEAFLDLHRRIREAIVARAERATGREQQQAFADLLFLHRGNPMAAPIYSFGTLGTGHTRQAGPDDAEVIVGMLGGAAAQDDPDRARVIRHWHAVDPSGFRVHEDAGGRPLGSISFVRLDRASAAERAADPVAAWLWETVLPARRAPTPGEPVLYSMDPVEADGDPLGTMTNLHAAASCVAWMLPRLGWALVVTVHEARWAPMWSYIGFERLGTLERDGVRWAAWGRDFARSPYADWGKRLAGLELGPASEPPPRPVEPLALSSPDFADAVRQALRDLHRPDRLAASPLAASRLAGAAGIGAAGGVLAQRITHAVHSLGDSPRDERGRRALERTYLRPATTQEAAAEVLGLPFSTYRRHLNEGVERLVEVLWSWELHGPPTLGGEAGA